MYSTHSRLSSEDARTGHSVIVGVAEERSFHDTVAYYSLNLQRASYWFEFFGFGDLKRQKKKERRKRGATAERIKEWLAKSEGKEVAVWDIAEALDLSEATVYKFKRDNPGWFRKTTKGFYEIVNVDKERAEAKGYV